MNLADTEFAAYIAGLGVGAVDDRETFTFEYSTEDVSTHSIIHALLKPYEAWYPETLLTDYFGIRFTVGVLDGPNLGSALIIRSRESATAHTTYTITLSGVVSRDGQVGTGTKTLRSLDVCAIEIGNNLIEAVRQGRVRAGEDIRTTINVFNVPKPSVTPITTPPTTRSPVGPTPRPWHC